MDVATRLALVFALGTCLVGAVAFVLAIGRIMMPATFLPLLLAVTVGLWFLALRKGSIPTRWRALAGEVRAEPFALGVGAAVLVGFAILRLGYSPLQNFFGSSPWRYWADGREIALAHRIPSLALQYGMLLTPTTNKVLLNTLDAGAIFILGRDPLPGFGAMLWIGSVGLAAALWALGRELGLRHTAILLPVLALANELVMNREFTSDLITFKAEIFGRMVAFAALAVAVRALRRRHMKDAVVAGLLFGAGAAIHLVPVLIALIMLAFYGLAVLIVDRGLGAFARQAAAMAVAFIALGGVLLVLPHGDLGLRGATGNSAYSSFGPGFDPTFYVNTGRLTGRLSGHIVVGPRTWYLPPQRAAWAFVGAATGLIRAPASVRGAVEWLLAVGGLLAAAAMLVFFPRELRPVGVMCYGLLVSIVGLTWLISLRYHLYIQARFGVRRLFDYASIPLIIFGLALIEGALLLLTRSARGRTVRPWVPGVALAVVAVVVSALVIPSARPPRRGDAPLDRGLIASFDWVRANIPCDARILANIHTEGVFEALTGRSAVLEGMTPYLRPSVLAPIVRLFLDARRFFVDPQGNQAFLAREGVDYVVILHSGGVGYSLPIGRIDQAALASAPFLEPMYSSPAMTVYRVHGVARPAGLPVPSSARGFRCEREPIRS